MKLHAKPKCIRLSVFSQALLTPGGVTGLLECLNYPGLGQDYTHDRSLFLHINSETVQNYSLDCGRNLFNITLSSMSVCVQSQGADNSHLILNFYQFI